MSPYARTLCRGLLLLGALAAAVAPVRAAPSGQPVHVEVVDVAGGRAYITPGQDAGLREGGRVRFGKRLFVIEAVSASGAVVQLDKGTLQRGDKGRARVRLESEQGGKRREKPRELGMFVGQWPKPSLPASEQHPKPVPLGPPEQSQLARALVSLRAAGSVPLSSAGSPWARGELRARVTAEPFRSLPLRLDMDAAVQLWAASGGSYQAASASRPLLRVRAFEVGYGQQASLFAAAGRLRYAASTVGQLDGVKVQSELVDGLRLAAFGGFMPDPLSGKPTLDSARFGGELTWEDLSGALRPRVGLSVQATRFDGALDERRAHLTADIFPGRSHVGAYVLGSLFDRDNPFRARQQELSAAGGSFEVRAGELQLSGRFDMRRPERSRWLASFLPPGWFCARRAAADGSAEDECHGSDARYLAQGDVGWYRPDMVVNAGVTVSRTRYVDSEQLAGFANVSLLHLLQSMHLDAGLFAQTGSLIRSAALSLGGGALLAHDNVDVSLRYRPSLNRYYADTAPFLEHMLSANLLWGLGSELSLTLSADAIAGRDVSVLLLQSMLQWRPGSA